MSFIDWRFLGVYRTTDWSNLSGLDIGLITFNAVEAMIWFTFAGYVLVRNHRGHRSAMEYAYGVLFVLFGVSDLIECVQLSNPLILAKAVILVLLLVFRHWTLARYEPRPKLV